jgi:hypothetical protein
MNCDGFFMVINSKFFYSLLLSTLLPIEGHTVVIDTGIRNVTV